jgi:cystathionine beta-synthase
MRHRRPYASVLDTIGWTPLIRLNSVVDGARSPVYAKAEASNGSSAASISTSFKR